jgi:hypothetical protein
VLARETTKLLPRAPEQVDDYMEGLIQFAQAVVPGSARMIASVGDERNALSLLTVEADFGGSLSRRTPDPRPTAGGHPGFSVRRRCPTPVRPPGRPRR